MIQPDKNANRDTKMVNITKNKEIPLYPNKNGCFHKEAIEGFAQIEIWPQKDQIVSEEQEKKQKRNKRSAI